MSTFVQPKLSILLSCLLPFTSLHILKAVLFPLLSIFILYHHCLLSTRVVSKHILPPGCCAEVIVLAALGPKGPRSAIVRELWRPLLSSHHADGWIQTSSPWIAAFSTGLCTMSSRYDYSSFSRLPITHLQSSIHLRVFIDSIGEPVLCSFVYLRRYSRQARDRIEWSSSIRHAKFARSLVAASSTDRHFWVPH